LIIPDANVLLYAYNADAPQGGRAASWLESTFSGTEPVRLPWQCVLAFLRIATNPRAFDNPFPMEAAIDVVRQWFQSPSVGLIDPGERYWEILSRLLVDSQASGKLVSDAAIAALAIENGATLATTDKDFRRFDGLKLLDPLREG